MTRQKLHMLATAMISIACAGCQQPQVLPDAEAAAFAEEVDAIVENALTGLSEGSYEHHTRDFDSELRDRVDPVTFPQIFDEIIGTLGAYQSHTLVRVEDQGMFRTVVYQAVFERDLHAEVRVVFRRSDPDHRINGLWVASDLLTDP